MEENTTFNDLLLFAFNETQLSKTVAVVHAIETDLDVSESFEEIKEVLSVLKQSRSNPSEETLQNILKHA